MNRRLDEFLKSSTVLITCGIAENNPPPKAAKQNATTGFCFAPGLILTAVEGIKSSHDGLVKVGTHQSGQWVWLSAQVQEICPDIGLAIVMLLEDYPLDAVYLGQGIHRGDRSYSYETLSDQPHRLTLTCESVSQDFSGLIRLRGDRANRNLGGAPLFNQRTGEVCGVLLPQKLGSEADYYYDAVPIHQLYQKFPALSQLQASVHGAHSTWTPLLEKRMEAMPVDWRYFDRDWQSKRNYLKASWLLVKTYCKWRSLNAFAEVSNHPTLAIKALLQALRQGKLGAQMQQQHEKLLWRFLLNVQPRQGNQADLIYELEAQAGLIAELMTLLMTEVKDGAGLARLSWSRDVLHEQRTILTNLKTYAGNLFPAVESWQQRLGINAAAGDLEMVDRILGNLLSRHLVTDGEPDGIDQQQRPQLTALAWEGVNPKAAGSLDGLLQQLDREIDRHPQLTLLRKLQLLVEAYGRSAQVEAVQIGPYRAWSEAGAYHSHGDCKFYPQPKTPEEFAKIIHYSDRNEAEDRHRQCKLCASIEQSILAGTYGLKKTPEKQSHRATAPAPKQTEEVPLIELESISTAAQGEMSGELRLIQGDGPVDPKVLARNISRLSAYITEPDKVKAG